MNAKSIYCFVMLVIVVSCSSGPGKVSSSDEMKTDSLIARDDLANNEPEDENGSPENEQNPDKLIQNLDDKIDSVIAAYSDQNFLTIYSTFNGYEASAEGKWVVDSDIQLKYCEISRNMEYTSATQTYYFDGDQIRTGDEDNFYNDYEEKVTIYNNVDNVYGYSRTNGTENDSAVYFLQEGDYVSKNETVKNEFTKLLKRIQELQDSVTENDDEIIIRVSEVVNYGEDFTQTEEYRLTKKSFQKIISKND